MIGLILCAGKGTRMKPLSDILPKPLLPIGHKPVIARTIESMIQLDFDQIGLVIRKEEIDIFQRFHKKFYPELSLDIFYQEELSGIITAIRSAKKYQNHRVLACAGDTVFVPSHIQPFIDQQGSADILIGIQKRDPQEISRRSNIIVDKDNIVIKSIEKPDLEQITSPWSGVPIWMFDKHIWEYFRISPATAEGEYNVDGVTSLAIQDHKVVKGIEVNGTEDITYPKDVLELNFDYIRDLLGK